MPDSTPVPPLTYWNGEPANVVRGWARVDGKRVRIVRVFYADQQFDLDDSDEQAWRKVTNGFGSPMYGHRGVTVEPHSLVPDSWGPLVALYFRSEGLGPDGAS